MDETWGLTQLTRVEVVVGGEDVPVVAELFSEVGATGFTAVSNVSGLGHSGYHQGRLLFNDRNALALLTVVLPNCSPAWASSRTIRRSLGSLGLLLKIEL